MILPHIQKFVFDEERSLNFRNIVNQCATQLELKKYYNICLEERQALNYPPFSWIVRLEVRCKSKSGVEGAIHQLKNRFKNIPKSIEILGPAYCYPGRLSDYYRMQIVLKSKKDFDNWTKSESFRKAHKGAGSHRDIYLEHPQFEGFEVII